MEKRVEKKNWRENGEKIHREMERKRKGVKAFNKTREPFS